MKEYQTFCKELELAISEKLPVQLKADIHKIKKNNDIELDALAIVSNEGGISPNFYLQDYYEKYKNGNKLEALVEEIFSVYFCAIQDNKFENISLSFSDCKEKIFFRLVSYEKNRKLLQTIPHKIFLDMAIIYYILFSVEETGIRSIRVSNNIMELWELDEEALFLLAKENTPVLFPKRICTMFSMMSELAVGDATQESVDKAMLPIPCSIEDREPYVITNQQGINGAVVILYQSVLEEVAQLTEGDYYLLPSSIHEMLVVSGKSKLRKKDLVDMVQEVNETCVSDEEILSDRIYYYSVADRRLSIG